MAYLSALFADNDFDVVSAANGQEGFEMAKSRHPDLITLDISNQNCLLSADAS